MCAMLQLKCQPQVDALHSACNISTLSDILRVTLSISLSCLLFNSTSRFFPRGARSHSQYALLPTHGGMAQAESTWVPGSVPRWFTRVKMVTHPDTNQARRRVTALIKSNTLLLHCSSIILTHVLVSAPLKSIDYNVAMTFILNNNNNDNNHTDGILCVKCR